MAKQETNIYDLVDTVNKNKKKSSMEREKDYDDILSMLDDIKEDNDISTEEVRERVNNYTKRQTQINDSLENYTNTVIVPSLPNKVTNYDSYSECIFAYIQAVDYGTNNSKEYVKGHKAALEKYYTEISNNRKDIYVIEAHVNDEINSVSSKESLYDKGYYDGLFYIHRAIKKAKSLMAKDINDKLKEILK